MRLGPVVRSVLVALAMTSGALAEPPKVHPAPAVHVSPPISRAPAVRPATPSLDVSIPVRAARRELIGVRDDIARQVRAGARPVVVFDIDDTLLTWPRPDLPERQEVPGALAYLRSLKMAGAKIVYITGRHTAARAETIEHLQQHGFPIGTDEQLMLNETELPTVEYKAVAARSVVRTLGIPVAVFENEKENARMFRRELPEASTAVFRLRTTTMRPDPSGDGPITVIDDFTPALPREIHLSR